MDVRLNYAPCGYVSITHEGIMADVNQTFLDMMGYQQEDLVQKHFETLMSTANKLIFHSYFYPYIHLDGHVEELLIRLQEQPGRVGSLYIEWTKVRAGRPGMVGLHIGTSR